MCDSTALGFNVLAICGHSAQFVREGHIPKRLLSRNFMAASFRKVAPKSVRSCLLFNTYGTMFVL